MTPSEIQIFSEHLEVEEGRQMPGIELSQMDDDLVFDEKTPAKPKQTQSQPAQVVRVRDVQETQAKAPNSFQEEETAQKISPLITSPASQPAQVAQPKPLVPEFESPSTQTSPPIHERSAIADIRPADVRPADVRQADVQQPMMSQTSQSSILLLNERKAVRSTASPTEKRAAMELFETLLGSASKGGASDLLLKQGQVPMFRWNGELYPSRNGPRLESSFIEILASVILTPMLCERLDDMHDVDFSYQSLRSGRVRVNIFHQRGELGLVARLIPNEVPSFEKLEMNRNVRNLVDHKRGLILVTGATGSGKSTTLAAMLDYINSTRTSHIITIEDPIEFIHHDKKSLFNQRELGLDTRSYAAALKSALRQAPDVILVGELRDAETTEVALQAAETGHLVLSTIHTNDAADSILRILGMTGQEKEAVIRAQLADTLRGVVSQRLVKRKDRPGRVAAQEVMINTATIREKLIKGGHPSIVRDFIAQGVNQGMQSFDYHLIQLVQAGVVDYEEALRNASNRDDFALRYNGVGDGREAS